MVDRATDRAGAAGLQAGAKGLRVLASRQGGQFKRALRGTEITLEQGLLHRTRLQLQVALQHPLALRLKLLRLLGALLQPFADLLPQLRRGLQMLAARGRPLLVLRQFLRVERGAVQRV